MQNISWVPRDHGITFLARIARAGRRALEGEPAVLRGLWHHLDGRHVRPCRHRRGRADGVILGSDDLCYDVALRHRTSGYSNDTHAKEINTSMGGLRPCG
jgi:hypothetical protein